MLLYCVILLGNLFLLRQVVSVAKDFYREDIDEVDLPLTMSVNTECECVAYIYT